MFLKNKMALGFFGFPQDTKRRQAKRFPCGAKIIIYVLQSYFFHLYFSAYNNLITHKGGHTKQWKKKLLYIQAMALSQYLA